MRFEHEGLLVDDLERGIGDVKWDGHLFDASLRLRLDVCGLASYAMHNVLQQNHADVRLVESSPNLYGETSNSNHVFIVANTEEGEFIIDPTYTQFLDTVGLTRWYVTFGGQDLYPDRKIAVVKLDEADTIAHELADAADHFRAHREDIGEELSVHPMEDMTHDELVAEFSKIWNPDNFGEYDIEAAAVERPGLILAHFIVPEHVKLVA